MHKPRGEQRYGPLGFTGYSFKGSEFNWSIADKEAFAIVHTFPKLNYLFVGKYRLYTDHSNLTTILAPSGHKNATQRLFRWSMSYPPFSIEHVPRDENVWAHMLSRWEISTSVRVISVDQLRMQPLADFT